MTGRGDRSLWGSCAEVHLWLIPLSKPAPAAAFQILSPEEQCRAGRFAAGHLRERYVASHAALRRILGDCTAQAPEAVKICVEPRGRPRLAERERSSRSGKTDPGPIDFSFTHTRDLAIVALARGLRLGVDLERSDRRVRVDQLAPHVLSADERAWMARAEEAERGSRFLRLWTAKEALLKATGWGLYLDPQNVRVDWPERRGEVCPGFPPIAPDPGIGAAPSPDARDLAGRSGGASRWHLREIELPAGWVATLASDRPIDTLVTSQFCWSEEATL